MANVKNKNLCPICKKKVSEYLNNKFFPFCSKKCKNIDLFNWLSSKYYLKMDF